MLMGVGRGSGCKIDLADCDLTLLSGGIGWGKSRFAGMSWLGPWGLCGEPELRLVAAGCCVVAFAVCASMCI